MPFRRTAVAALALTVLIPIVPAAAAASPPDLKLAKELPRPTRPHEVREPAYDPHTVLVRFKPGASTKARDRVLKDRGARSVGAVAGTGFIKVRAAGTAADLLRQLQKDPAVQSASLDYRRQISATPNDLAYNYGDQGYLDTVRLPQAWDRTKGSTSQVIAVVDTGVNGVHEDLKGRVVSGYNAISNVPIAAGVNSDDYGHGSMVAGIAAANTNNDVGIAGVDWTARVMPVKVLDSEGSGFDSDVAEGVIWAADHGAKIINLSLGGPDDSPVLHDAVRYATGKGATLIVAAGNSGANSPEYPAAYPEVLAVGATDNSGNLTDFSTWGDWVDVAAPGFDIVSTGEDGDYWIAAGTSFAAPIVSGVAALVRTVYPTLTPAQLMARLRSTARDSGPRGIDPYYGYGVLDANHAVGGALGSAFPMRDMSDGEPNDVPARSSELASGTFGYASMEGDVDWYRYDSTGLQSVKFQVAPPTHDPDRAQNFDPILAVYDSNLRLLGEVDSDFPNAVESLTVTAGVGRYYVAVRNYNGGPDLRAYRVTTTTALVPPFLAPQSTPVGSWPESTAIGDVTGDGRNDVLATTSYGNDPANDYKLFVYTQKADGSLAPPVRYATEPSGRRDAGLALLDANGDGRRDAAVVTEAGVQIFHQTEAGALESAGVVPNTTGGQYVVAGDVDADGDSDLVMSGFPSGIVLLTQAPAGSFTASVLPTQTGMKAEVGDINGDGRLDIVSLVPDYVQVYRNAGADGWIRTDHSVGFSWNLGDVGVADVSGDGLADIIATGGGNLPYTKVGVLLQTAAGGLTGAFTYSVGNSPELIEAADINGDSLADVVTAHTGFMSVLLQQTNGTLKAPLLTSGIPAVTHLNQQGLSLGDINGDGRTDAVIADSNGGLTVLRGNGVSPTPGGEQVWVRDVTPADFTVGFSDLATPSVTFQRAIDPATITAETVRLLDGRTGKAVPTRLSYDPATRTVTFKPLVRLQHLVPYRIVVGAVHDQAGAVHEGVFTTTFDVKRLLMIRRSTGSGTLPPPPRR